jgi:CubicO group peptidase (beta-lactamase class C family)
MLAPRRLLCAVIGITAAVIVAPRATAQPSSDELIAQVGTIARDAVASERGVGLSVAVMRGGEMIMEAGYGLADLEFEAPADAETMFRIGSITKQFTAALVMRKVEAGELSLDDPLTKFFPDWPAPGEDVTIRHLLNHTSGIRSYTGIEGFMESPQVDRTNDEMLAVFRDEPWDFAPGEQWSYNNSGYYLLGVILEQIDGRPWSEQVDALAQELGLDRTRVDSNRAVLRNRAQGYAWEDGSFTNDRFIAPSVPGAAGAMLSTAGDLVRWSEMLASGEVVSEASYEQMLVPASIGDGETHTYGFGLMVGPLDDEPAVAHGGGIFGFNSFLARFPTHDDLTIAVISNSPALNSNGVALRILRAAIGKEAPEAEPLDADVMTAVQGTYRVDAVNLEISVFEREGALFTRAGEQPAFALIHEGGGVFRLDVPQRIELTFDLTESPSPGFTLRQGGAELPAVRIEPAASDE